MRARSALVPAAIAALLVGAWACQSLGLAARQSLNPLPFAFQRRPPAGLQPASLLGALSETRREAADWVYIDFLQYYGDMDQAFGPRWPRIKSMADEVLWLDPQFRFAVCYMAGALGWNNLRVDEAFDLLTEASRLDPTYTRYRLYLAGLAYKKMHDDRRAVMVLEAMATEPGRPEVLARTLGNLYMKRKEWDKARMWWLHVMQESQDRRTLDMAKKSLREIERHGY